MWEAVKEVAPWAAVAMVVVGWIFSSGKQAAVLDRLATALDKLADRVNTHEVELAVAKVQISNLESRPH